MASPTDMSLFPVLAAEKLPLPDIERAFHLSQTNRTDWAQFRTPFEIPDSETSRGEGLGQVGLRYRLSVLLCSIHCAAPDDPGFPGLPQIPISGKRRFSFQPVIYDGDEWCLRGSPDYSIWYNAETREDGPGVSALIREMREGRASRGVPQTLALMGVSVPATLVSTLTISLCMVYAHRQCEDKARKTVFGLSTDGAQFCFLHINGDGEWSQLDLHYSRHRQQIIETLAYLHKHASILSASDCADGPQAQSDDRTEAALFLTDAFFFKPDPEGDLSTLCVENRFRFDPDADVISDDDWIRG